MKNVIIKSFLTILVLLNIILFNEIHATNSAGGSGGTGGGSSGTASGSTSMKSDNHIGVRMSLVSKNGKKIRSRDFLNERNENFFNYAVGLRGNTKTTNSMCSKVSYLADTDCANPGSVGSWTFIGTGWAFDSFSDLKNLFFINGFIKPGDYAYSLLNSGVDIQSYPKIITTLFKTLLSENFSDNKVYTTQIKQFLFSTFGLNEESLNAILTSGDLYIVYEPTAMIKLDSINYYGTFYELASLASNSTNANPAYGGGCKRGSPLLCNFADLLLRNMPCYTYTNSELYNYPLYKDRISVLTDNRNFYNFGGTSIQVGAYGGCKKTLTYKQTTEANGYGMGIIWLGELKASLSCDDVNKKYPNLKSDVEKQYTTGAKLETIYDNFKGKIVVDTNEEKNFSVDSKWYVNNCTCVSANYAFDNSYNTFWEKEYNDIINKLNISNVLGTDWYKVLNKIKLADIYPKLRDNVIRESSGNINLEMKNHIDGLNKLSKVKYSWMDLNGKKYNDLNCSSPALPNECEQVKKWYNTNKPKTHLNLPNNLNEYNSFSKDNLEKIRNEANILFQAYNSIYAKTNNTFWCFDCEDRGITSYKKTCLEGNPTIPNKDKPYNCTPQYNVGPCLEGENIYYKEESAELSEDVYWKNCIFDNNGYYDPNGLEKSYKEKNLGGKYCEVYCAEYVIGDFSSYKFTVPGGHHFKLPYTGVSGSRTCKTKSIDWDKYSKDVKENNAATRQAFINWQLELKANAVGYSQGECCMLTIFGCAGYYLEPDQRVVRQWEGEKYLPDSSCGGPKPTFFPEKFEPIYNQYLTRGKTFAPEMNKCYEWPKENIYTLEPKLSISYDDSATPSYNYKNELFEQGPVNYDFSDSANCSYETAKAYDKCNPNDRDCATDTTKTVIKCKENYYNATRSRTIHYNLEAGLFNFVLKQNNLSVNSITPPSENYLEIGYSNFPVSFRAKTVDINLDYNFLGHKRPGEQTTVVDNLLKLVNGTDYTNWYCKLKVGDDLICTDESCGGTPPTDNNTKSGIDLIFRPIDLKNPFPDIDSSNRNTGSNWCESYGVCAYNNKKVYDSITNNRDVKDEEVYKKKPMYTFALNPSTIKEIRNYNKKNVYTQYTGSNDGKNYDFKCATGTGRTCISDYLTKLIEMTNAKNLPGTCVNDDSRHYSDTNSFESCRY